MQLSCLMCPRKGLEQLEFGTGQKGLPSLIAQGHKSMKSLSKGKFNG
jgi:hypothetical protein